MVSFDWMEDVTEYFYLQTIKETQYNNHYWQQTSTNKTKSEHHFRKNFAGQDFQEVSTLHHSIQITARFYLKILEKKKKVFILQHRFPAK